MEVEVIGQKEVETAMYNMKKARRQGQIKCGYTCRRCCRGGSQVDRKATERVYAGGKDIERVEDGPYSADMEEERGWA